MSVRGRRDWGTIPRRVRLRYRSEAVLCACLTRGFRVLGIEASSALGGWIARQVGPLLRPHKVGLANLSVVFPNMTETERQAILRAAWDNIGRTCAEYAHFDKLTVGGPDSRITIKGIEHLEPILAEGKNAIFVSGHFANWELMPMGLRAAGLKAAEVYRAANNPYVDRWIVDLRKTFVLPHQVAKGAGGARRLMELARDGFHIAMLVDQKMNEGLPAPFFGREAMTSTAAAVLALRYDMPIVPASITRKPGARFEVTIYPPLPLPDADSRSARIEGLTRACNAFLEERIVERPGQWLWFHNRWPGLMPPRKKPRRRKTAEKTPKSQGFLSATTSAGSKR